MEVDGDAGIYVKKAGFHVQKSSYNIVNKELIMKTRLLLLVMILFFLPLSSYAEEEHADIPEIHYLEKDKCPVCNMFVAKNPNWAAQIAFRDGTYVVFDGPRDMFTYYFHINAYNQGKTKEEVKDMLVLEYYNLKPVYAEDAFFVIGSDILGPMGREIIPFDTMEAAKEFKRDHQGKEILRFGEVTNALIEEMRTGQTMTP